MGRYLFGLAAAAALIATPQGRGWVVPRVQPALDVPYEWHTRQRVREIAQLLEARAGAGRPLPTPRDFPSFLNGHYYKESAHLDSWGTPLFLKRERRQLSVGSAGRDRERGTEDDILVLIEGVEPTRR